MKQSLFIVSLDFELLWGVRDKRTIETYGENIRGVRKVIPSLLELFEKYGIKATFATVGFLFAKDKKELEFYIPTELPDYNDPNYSPYANGYMNSIGTSESGDIYHYGHSLVNMIGKYPSQEIGSHTFCHYYCLENASISSFRADLQAAKRIASSMGIDLKSIVFPRNQYSPQHISICKELGFVTYRGNPESKMYNPRKNEDQKKILRALRLADSYLNISGHNCFEIHTQDGIVNIPASSFLRPYSSKLKMFEKIRLNRIKESLTYAAKNNLGYHLWWHPHNFGKNLEKNLKFLEQVLVHFQKLQKEYGMQSKTMKQIAEEILKPHAV